MEARFEPIDAVTNLSGLDFTYSETILSSERQKAREYISNAVKTFK